MLMSQSRKSYFNACLEEILREQFEEMGERFVISMLNLFGTPSHHAKHHEDVFDVIVHPFIGEDLIDAYLQSIAQHLIRDLRADLDKEIEEPLSVAVKGDPERLIARGGFKP